MSGRVRHRPLTTSTAAAVSRSSQATSSRPVHTAVTLLPVSGERGSTRQRSLAGCQATPVAVVGSAAVVPKTTTSWPVHTAAACRKATGSAAIAVHRFSSGS